MRPLGASVELVQIHAYGTLYHKLQRILYVVANSGWFIEQQSISRHYGKVQTTSSSSYPNFVSKKA